MSRVLRWFFSVVVFRLVGGLALIFSLIIRFGCWLVSPPQTKPVGGSRRLFSAGRIPPSRHALSNQFVIVPGAPLGVDAASLWESCASSEDVVSDLPLLIPLELPPLVA